MDKHSANELKQYFLDNAKPLLEGYIGAALGDEDAIKSVDRVCRNEVWDLLKEVIKEADDKIYLEEKYRSKDGIMEAIYDGKITFEEGNKLLNFYGKLKEIEVMVGTNPDTLINAPSVTINTTEHSGEVIEGSFKDNNEFVEPEFLSDNKVDLT